jgi:RNA-dependent RNA polymerase
MEEVTSGLSNHCMAICEGQGQEGYPVMMAIDDPPDWMPPWEWDQNCIEVENIVPRMASQANQMLMQYGEDCIEVDNIVPGMASQANQMLMQYGEDCIEVDNIVPGMASQANQMLMQYGDRDHDRIQELVLIVPHGVLMLAESPGNGRPSELQNHVQNGIPEQWMIPADQRMEPPSSRLQHVLRCLQGVGPFGHHIGPECAIMIPKPEPNVVVENAFRESASPHITENELRETASPEMCALEDLEFGKRFLILSYLCQ